MKELIPSVRDREEGEVPEHSVGVDPLAEYDALLASQVDRSDQLGPALPENILGPFARIVAPSFSLPIVRGKREQFPRPANAANLRAPKLKDMFEVPGFTSPEGKRVDKALTTVQGNMTAAMTAVAKGATVAVEFKAVHHPCIFESLRVWNQSSVMAWVVVRNKSCTQLSRLNHNPYVPLHKWHLDLIKLRTQMITSRISSPRPTNHKV
jgi:hypothetical protein